MKFIKREDEVAFKRYYSFKKVTIRGNLIIYKDGNRVGKRKTLAYLNNPPPEVITRIRKLSEELSSKKGLIRELKWGHREPVMHKGHMLQTIRSGNENS